LPCLVVWLYNCYLRQTAVAGPTALCSALCYKNTGLSFCR